MMEKRMDDRIDFTSLGTLSGNGSKIHCHLVNISTKGASVKMIESPHKGLHQGDIVRLKTTFLSPVELQCKVIRIDSTRIAVQFLKELR